MHHQDQAPPLKRPGRRRRELGSESKACSHCGRSFKRTEHLERHLRMQNPVKGTYNQFVLDPPFQLIDALPPGLEVPRLYDYEAVREEEVDGQVDELMRLNMDKLPNLKVVEGVEEMIEKMSRRSSKSWKEQLWIRLGREMHWVRDKL